jgi:hypothetical protein
MEQIKRIKGRRYLKDFSDEDKVPFQLNIKRNINAEIAGNRKDPLFVYLDRYIKESGF